MKRNQRQILAIQSVTNLNTWRVTLVFYLLFGTLACSGFHADPLLLEEGVRKSRSVDETNDLPEDDPSEDSSDDDRKFNSGTDDDTDSPGDPEDNGASGRCQVPESKPSLDQITWFDDVSAWPETATIESVQINSRSISFPYSHSDIWPHEFVLDSYTPLVGNVWIVAFTKGRWYAATWDWLKPSQTSKSVTASELGSDQIRRAPLDSSWEPCSGSMVGFMVSTIARNGNRGGRQERSAIHWTRWP